jgi:hypothetical protein
MGDPAAVLLQMEQVEVLVVVVVEQVLLLLD